MSSFATKNTVLDVYVAGQIDTFPRSAVMTGTVSTNPSLTGGASCAVVGSGTSFTAEYKSGDWIVLIDPLTLDIETRKVKAVSSDELLFVMNPFLQSYSNLAARKTKGDFCLVDIAVIGDTISSNYVQINKQNIRPSENLLPDTGSTVSLQFEKPADPRSADRNLIDPITIVAPAPEAGDIQIVIAATRY